MPHIPKDNYDQARSCASDAGELTYALYDMVCHYVMDSPSETIRYQRICEVRGALVGTMSEFDRLIAHPYEDTAIAKNGDATPAKLYEMLKDAQVRAVQAMVQHESGPAPLRTMPGPNDLPVTAGPVTEESQLPPQ